MLDVCPNILKYQDLDLHLNVLVFQEVYTYFLGFSGTMSPTFLNPMSAIFFSMSANFSTFSTGHHVHLHVGYHAGHNVHLYVGHPVGHHVGHHAGHHVHLHVGHHYGHHVGNQVLCKHPGILGCLDIRLNVLEHVLGHILDI